MGDRNRFKIRVELVLLLLMTCFLTKGIWGAVLIEADDPQFRDGVEKELSQMREGRRGIVCQVMIRRLDEAAANTVVTPLTDDELTWHPNDTRGTRSHVVAIDTKIRGAARASPTEAKIFLNPNRINSRLSTFRLGSFAYVLAKAMDLNAGMYSGDFKIREKRANFFRNAWRDSLGEKLLEISGRVAVPEYRLAKERNFIDEAHSDSFPILDVSEETPTDENLPPMDASTP